MEDFLLLYTIMSYPLIIGYVVTILANDESVGVRRMSNAAYIVFVALAPLTLLFVIGGMLFKKIKE